MPRAQGCAGAAIQDVLSGIMLLQFLSAYVHVSDAAGAGMRRTLTGRKWLKASGTSFPAAIQDQLIYIFVNIHK